MTVDQAVGKWPGLAEAPAMSDAAGGQAPVIRLEHRRRRDGDRPIRVLVVGDAEDFADIRDLLARAEQARFEVDRVADAATALARLARRQHDVCLCDQHLPDDGGPGLARQAAEQGGAAPVILMSGSAEPNLDLDAIAAGAADFFDKEQFAVESLERAIRMALARARRRDRAEAAVVLLALERLDALERQVGREAVDALLEGVAEQLSGCTSAADGPLRRTEDAGRVAALGSIWKLVQGSP